MNFLKSIARFVAKGKTVMFAYTMSMIALSWYATVAKTPIDGSVATMYSAALVAYAGSKGHELYEANKNKITLKEGEINASA